MCFQRSAAPWLRRTRIIRLICGAEMFSAWRRKWTRINIFRHGVMVHSSQHHHAFVNTDAAQTAKRWIFKLNKNFPICRLAVTQSNCEFSYSDIVFMAQPVDLWRRTIRAPTWKRSETERKMGKKWMSSLIIKAHASHENRGSSRMNNA